jgi:outer membrane protein
MKKELIFTAAMLFFAAGARAGWTLQQCIDHAMKNNITLQKARLEGQSAQEDVKGARGALLPTVSASTNQSLGYQPWKDNGITTVTNGTVNTKIDKAYYNGSYGLNAQWTVWNGNRNLNTLKLNKLTAEQQALQAEVTANSIQEQIAQLYVQILYLTEAVRVNEQSLETSRKNEERGKEMLEVGKMSRADVAQLSAQRASDEYNIVESRANISKYKLQLKQLLELDGTQDFDIVVPPTTDSQALADIPDLQAVFEQAMTTRPEIRSSELAVKSSELSIKSAKAGWLPTVNMTGGVGTNTNSLSSNAWGTQLKTNFDASAGVSVSIPIFDGRQTKTNVNKARIRREQAVLDMQDSRKMLYQTIENFWLDAVTNQQKFRSATLTEQSEQQSYDLLSEQFRLGLKNIVELMTGKDRLLAAQQSKLQSKYLTILAQQMLSFYAGEEIK